MKNQLTYEEQQLLKELQFINHDTLWGHAIKKVIDSPTVTRFRGLVIQLKQQNNDNPAIMKDILQTAYNSFLLC